MYVNKIIIRLKTNQRFIHSFFSFSFFFVKVKERSFFLCIEKESVFSLNRFTLLREVNETKKLLSYSFSNRYIDK